MATKLEIPLEAVLKLISEFEKLDTELEAYRLMLAAFKKAHAPDADSLDAVLVGARRSPLLREKMKQKYDAIREILRKQELDARSEIEISRLIEQLRPEDPLN